MLERSSVAMSEEQGTYDPIAVQMDSLSPLVSSEIEIDDLCTPTSVRLLIGQQLVNLVQLKSLSSELVDLRAQNRALTDYCSDLRVNAAKSRERDLMSWIEIPVGALLGFATGMTLDPTTRVAGLVTVLVAVVVLLFVRSSHIIDLAKLVSGKERIHV
jgi:hypothetical protein